MGREIFRETSAGLLIGGREKGKEDWGTKRKMLKRGFNLSVEMKAGRG